MSKIDQLPDFVAANDEGNQISSRDLIGKPLVIFFYPKDFSYGCTAEVCSFRDAYHDFEDIGATVYGVSSDSESSHKKFREKHNLPFKLLSDPDKKLRKAFGVRADLFGLLPGRETFIFNSEGKLIHHFKSQAKYENHVGEAINAIKQAES